MDEAGRKKLLEVYAKMKSPEIREQLILEYAPLVKVVAGRLSMYLGYNVEYEDLVSYGIFGLIDAIDKFDYLKDVKFETYASLGVRQPAYPRGNFGPDTQDGLDSQDNQTKAEKNRGGNQGSGAEYRAHGYG